MKYYMGFVCIVLASFNLNSNCLPSRQTDNLCANQPSGSFLTHPLGCKYFIVCNNGIANMGSCPDGLAFNPLRPPCDLEANVNCDDETTTSTLPTTVPTTTRTTTPAPTTTTSTTLAPTTTTSTTLEPTTTTTTTTTTLEPTTTTTTSTTLEPTTPRTTSTTLAPTTTTSTTPVTTTTTITPPTITTEPHHSPDLNIPPEIQCPEQDDPNEIVYLASNTDCSKYYICYHNRPIEKTCSPNLHWNIKTKKCDTIERAKCTVSTMPSFFPVCPRDAVGMYPHPLNCEWFLYCYHGHMTVQQCPFFYNWDSESESCQLKPVANCVLYSQ